MNVSGFVSELQRRGIPPYLDAMGELCVPVGPALTTQVQERILQSKPALIAFLRSDQWQVTTPAVITEIPAQALRMTADAPKAPRTTLAPLQDRELDIFDDAEIVVDAPDWEERGACESRVGTEKVLLCDDQRPRGFFAAGMATGETSDGEISDHPLLVYRLAEVEALRELGICREGLPLQNYHRRKSALLSVMEPRTEYALAGPAVGINRARSWEVLVKRAGVEPWAETLLTVLTEGGVLHRGERSMMTQWSEYVAGYRSLLWRTQDAWYDLLTNEADPFTEYSAPNDLSQGLLNNDLQKVTD